MQTQKQFMVHQSFSAVESYQQNRARFLKVFWSSKIIKTLCCMLSDVILFCFKSRFR